MPSVDLGLPQIILDLLAGQSEDKSLYMKYNINSSGHFTELRITWQPKYNIQHVQGMYGYGSPPIKHKHLPPSKVKRNKMRKEQYYKHKNMQRHTPKHTGSQCKVDDITPVNSTESMCDILPVDTEIPRYSDSMNCLELQSSPVSMELQSSPVSIGSDTILSSVDLTLSHNWAPIFQDSISIENSCAVQNEMYTVDYKQKFKCGHTEDMNIFRMEPLYLCTKCNGKVCSKCYSNVCLNRHRQYLKIIYDT